MRGTTRAGDAVEEIWERDGRATRPLPRRRSLENSQDLSEWLASLSVAESIRALALVYSSLTVYSRELFLPDRVKGNDQVVVDILHGLNELHHTIANQLVSYACDKEGYSPRTFSQMLLEIANKYCIEGFLMSAVEFARTRSFPLEK